MRVLCYCARTRNARQLGLGSGILALSVLADSGLEHYRGSFQNRAMYLPLAVAALLAAQTPTVRTTVDEVLLDLIVRDKKGKPVTDLKPEDLTVFDNGVKQTLTSFRLVSGAEAIGTNGAKTALDPLRQLWQMSTHIRQ